MPGFWDMLMGRNQGYPGLPGAAPTGVAGQGAQPGTFSGAVDNAFNSPLFHVGLGLLGTGRIDQGIPQGLMSYSNQRTQNERRGLLGLQQQQLYTQMMEQQRKRQQAAQYRESLAADDPQRNLPDEQLLAVAAARAARGPERPIVAGNRVLDPNDPSKVLADLRETPEERKLRLEQEAEIKGRIDRPQFGLQPFWGVDEQSNPVPMQLNNRGGVQRIPMPEGVNPAGQFEKVDLGTEYVLIDRQTRQPTARIPKNVAGKAAAEKAGTDIGGAVATAPGALAAADQITRHLDELEKHPGLTLGTGLTAWTSAIPGSPMADFEARRQQIQGQAFLQQYQALRGGGAITEAEGAKASAALARLQTAVSEKDFRAALKDFRREIGVLRGIAEKRAQTGRELGVPGMPPGTPPATAGKPGGRLKFNPATGEIE